MGLFDDIRVDYPIPGVEPFDGQTKDLDCCMGHYKIAAGGQLYEQHGVAWKKSHYTGQVNAYGDNADVLFWFRNGVVKDVVDLTKDQPNEEVEKTSGA
jgi:hypothetical protein